MILELYIDVNRQFLAAESSFNKFLVKKGNLPNLISCHCSLQGPVLERWAVGDSLLLIIPLKGGHENHKSLYVTRMEIPIDSDSKLEKIHWQVNLRQYAKIKRMWTWMFYNIYSIYIFIEIVCFFWECDVGHFYFGKLECRSLTSSRNKNVIWEHKVRGNGEASGCIHWQLTHQQVLLLHFGFFMFSAANSESDVWFCESWLG